MLRRLGGASGLHGQLCGNTKQSFGKEQQLQVLLAAGRVIEKVSMSWTFERIWVVRYWHFGVPCRFCSSVRVASR